MFDAFDISRPERVSDEALQRLAECAGEGELRSKAIRSIESVRATVELDGWVLLQELRLNGDIVIRHGLIGPQGIVVIVPAGPVATYEHAVDADRQARALAHELELRRDDIIAVLALFSSNAAPGIEKFLDFDICIIGDRQLVRWLDQLPRRLPQPLLDRLQAAIGDAERRASSKSSLILPATPLHG